MRIATRIWSGIGIVMAGFALTVAVGAYLGHKLGTTIDGTRRQSVPDALEATRLSALYGEAVRHYQDACLTQDPEVLKEGHTHAGTTAAKLAELASHAWLGADQAKILSDASVAIRKADDRAKDVYAKKAANAKDEGLDARVGDLTQHIQAVVVPQLASAIEAVNQALAADLSRVEATLSFQNSISIAVFCLAVIMSIILVNLIIRRSVVMPLRALTRQLEEIAGGGGDLTKRIPVARNKAGKLSDDELTVVADTVNRLMEQLQRLIAAVGADTMRVAGSATSLDALAKRVSTAAAETRTAASASAAGATEVSSSMQSLAAAIEQMLSSIKEISSRAQEASATASNAALGAKETDANMARLAEASAAIDQVVKLINAIAGKTNLLALNATIEAARAGEAGRGFTVVANEVKDLARQTGTATQDVQKSIGTIQERAAISVDAIRSIVDIVTRINESSLSIAGAVEEQTATTQEISMVVARASARASEIGTSVGQAAQAAQVSEECSHAAEAAARELSASAERLKELVGKFQV